MIIHIAEVQPREPERVDVELVLPADLDADTGAAIGLLEAGGEPPASAEADRGGDLRGPLDGGLVDQPDTVLEPRGLITKLQYSSRTPLSRRRNL